MILRASFIVLVAATFAFAGETAKLEQPFASSRAKSYRKKAKEAWETVVPVLELLQSDKPVEDSKLRAAMPQIELTVLNLERSLQLEWHAKVNDKLVEVITAWFDLRSRLPEPAPPEDPDEREKLEKERAKERKAQVREARKALLEARNARRPEKQLIRCRGCDGRGELRSAFGDKSKCKACGGVTRHVDREGILEAQFLPYSPVWRSDPRNEMKADRALRGADTNPSVLAPFVKSSQVKGAIEDHDFWVRIRLREKQYKEPGDKSLETVEQSFVLYRVGKVWYLHGGRIDHVLFELPPESEPEGAKEDDDGFGTED